MDADTRWSAYGYRQKQFNRFCAPTQEAIIRHAHELALRADEALRRSETVPAVAEPTAVPAHVYVIVRAALAGTEFFGFYAHESAALRQANEWNESYPRGARYEISRIAINQEL